MGTRNWKLAGLCAAMVALGSSSGWAAPPACNSGSEGMIVYNKDYKLVQVCNGTQWVGLTAKIGGEGDTLSDLNCQQDEVPVWNGSAWSCGQGAEGISVSTTGQVRIDHAGPGNTYDTWIQGGAGTSGTTRRLALLGTEAGMLYLNYNSEYALGTTIGGVIIGNGSGLTALDAANLASGTIPAARLPAYSGDVTKAAGGTALTIATGAVDLAHLSATGTKSSSTFLRGDNTWAAPSGGVASVTRQVFTASGTWTKPAGTIALIQCWGAGGSGARNSACSLSGGGGGGYIERLMPISGLSATVAVTIGTGGPGRTTVGAGTAGENTTFGSYVTAYGGAGGGTINCSGVGNRAEGGQVFSKGVGAGTVDETTQFWEGGSGTHSDGGAAVWGGGGGAGGGTSSSPGGKSLHGGKGGASGAWSSGVGQDGSVPGGGGGGGYGGSGDGGKGQCIITTW